MKSPLLYIIIFFAALCSCSSEKNTWTSKVYHNATAHYNGYYYAREEISKVEAAIRKNHVDDYNRVLRLYPTFDSTLAKSFDKELQEAIKMASIAIQRHPNSKWVDDAYILVGKARLYTLDWGNAIQTFKYTNKIGKDSDARHLAVINLIRTYTEHKEYNNAQAAIDYLQKEDLSRTNRKKFLLEKAYFYQIQNDYDKMVRNLTEASPLLKKSDRRGRIYFIIGQVYQKIGFESEAYNYYKKCLSTNPEYEVDFYARLYMAQVTEISRNKDINQARKSFRKLLKDSKNKDFKDKIYYEMGIFELKHDNLKEAIENLNLSIRTGTNKRIDGEAFLRLGEVYYDTLKQYELSQAYYDSAITSLPPDYEGYDRIKARQEILNEFVKHLKTIQWQDSLLTLSTLDSAALRQKVDSIFNERKKNEELRASKKKKKSRIQIEANDNNNLFASDDDDANAPEEAGDWYFANPTAMALGQTEFQRIWGTIPLEDNWRRSGKQTGRRESGVVQTDNATSSSELGEQNQGATSVTNPADAEFVKLDKEIPRTEEAKKQALKKIEEAYFKLGGIYYFKLQENSNAVDTYKTLLNRFPNSEYEPEVLYTLYLILKDSSANEATQYADLLKSKHPTSTFTKILINPDYLQESSLAAEKQKAIYKEAYTYFDSGNYDTAKVILQNAFALGETTFTPSLKLLDILIIGKTDDINKYQYELDLFVKNNPNETGAYAKKLLDASRNFQSTREKQKGISYIRSLEEPHYFVILYKQADRIDEIISTNIEQFNESNFSENKLKTSKLIFNDQFTIVFVDGLDNVTTAIDYYRTFNETLPSLNELRNHKFDNFVITKDNFDIFYRTKGLDEYLQFFEKNYPLKNP